MSRIEKINRAMEEARIGNYIITDKKAGDQYKYGENPFADMQIENACFVDMFPEEVADKTNYFGFNRNNWILEKEAKEVFSKAILNPIFDLREIPEELFDEISKKPDSILEPVDIDFYVSECPELIGNMTMELSKDKDDQFYMECKDREPIGDYGSRWVSRWYKCNDNNRVRELIIKLENN